jgi:hypothetical protein
MTLLTWRGGQQMVGFSIAHTMPGFMVLGVMFTLGAAAWCIAVGLVAVLRKRRLGRTDWTLLAATSLAICLQFVPYSTWQWVTIQALGFPKLESPAGRAMYDTLISAAASGDARLLQSLLGRGLDVDGPDRDGTTALYAASSSGRPQTVTYLLQHGARVNLQIRGGETALHAAARHGQLEIVKILVAAGANPAIKTDEGRGISASDVAWSAKNFSISEYLDAREQQPRGPR